MDSMLIYLIYIF